MGIIIEAERVIRDIGRGDTQKMTLEEESFCNTPHVPIICPESCPPLIH
jgi:hypothetical protein